MPRRSRDRLLFLRRSREIERVKEEGRRYQTPLFNLLSCSSMAGGEQSTRVAIVVGKRFGIAVRRNRAKRVFRELTRQVRTQLVPGHDVIVFPRRAALDIQFRQLRDSWSAALRHEGLLAPQLDIPCGDSSLR